MKHSFLLLLITLVSLNTFADKWVSLTNNNIESNIELVSENNGNSKLNFKLEGFYYTTVQTLNGEAWKINVKNGYPILNEGAPDLPLFAASMIIPGDANMEIRMVSSKFKEFNDIIIAPSKGNLYRNIDPSTVEYIFGKQYTVDDFYPSEIVDSREPYIVRDFRGQTILVQPFQYNPVTKTLRVYYDIEFEFVANGSSSINVLVDNSETINNQFEHIYKRHFLNYSHLNRYTPVEEHGNMLIISYGDFMDEMQPFIDWKIKSGTQVEIVDVATIGGASDIEQYIEDYYNNNGLTFVILVGDDAQVPATNAGGNDSDVAYSYVVGNDHYPDLFVGRFSAETEAHVETQVQRVLDYEMNPIVDTAWYSKSIGIASNQGPGDDNEMDYEHIRNITDLNLLPFTYNYPYEFFDGSQGGNDATGNPTPTMVGDAINSGATIINYTGHGSTFSWGSSGFSNNDINNLENNGKLPFIFSVACVNGNFVDYTCFAEAWMRHEYNGEPAGAIATLMSTINQSWNPPMRGQDEMNDILTETYTDNVKRTFGAIAMNGCMNMNDVYGSGGDEMTDTWTIFGDPSLEIRTAAPHDLVVSHPASLFLGSTSMNVSCSDEGALATLSMDGVILGNAFVESGSAFIEFDALTEVGTADIVVTSFNAIPYISTVDVVPAAGPYVVYAVNTLNDAAGNNNGLMDYSESILVTVGLSNVGADMAEAVEATISTTSDFVEIVNDNAVYGNISAGDTSFVTDGFSILVANNIPDYVIAHFNIVATDADGNTWESAFMLTGHAPDLEFVGFEIDDTNGNSNGKIEPGENFNFTIEIANNGSSAAYNVFSALEANSQYVSVNSGSQSSGMIDSWATDIVTFNLTADVSTPEGTYAGFDLLMNADHDITGAGSFNTIIGQKPVLLLNLSNSSSSDSMQACFNELQIGFDIETGMAEDLEIYQSVFILLGVYPNNHVLSTDEGNLIAQYLENGGRVYMEGGDAWAFDEQTAGHNMFHIKGIADGTGDLSNIIGEADGMMNGYFFEYEGENNYIDQLDALDDGILIFSNEDPVYGTGVSFENDIYKTIGTSFEFGGLVDGEGSTKDGLMAQILYFFGLDYTWTDINEFITESGVSAYPNPATDKVILSFDIESAADVSVDIYNIHGQTVKSVGSKTLSYGHNSISIDVSLLKPGVYFYNIHFAGNKSITKKLIIKR